MIINLAVTPYYKHIAIISKNKSTRIAYAITNDFGLSEKQYKMLQRKIRRYLINRIIFVLNIQHSSEITEHNFMSALNILRNSEYLFFNKIYK